MTDFKSELRKILKEYGRMAVVEHQLNQTYEGIDAHVDDIIALFISKGWVQMAYNPSEKTVAGKPIADVLVTNDTHMTGQEWYNKFEAELYKLYVQQSNRSRPAS